MMSSARSLDSLIRKLRKKLRQIENLERLNRPLTGEEVIKVDSKFSVRERLQAALEQREVLCDEDQQSEDEDEGNFPGIEQPENVESLRNTDLNTEDNVASPEQIEQRPLGSRESGDGSHQQKKDIRQVKAPRPEPPQADTKSQVKKSKAKTSQLSQSLCKISWLEGHSDLVTALQVVGDKLVTASRDTTVKCWDISEGREIHSYGGHTETVTSLSVLDADIGKANELTLADGDMLLISGSFDCTFKMWSLKTGQQLKSVYTYNPVVQICFCSKVNRLITASDGGKLELWNLASGENSYSSRAHDACITGVKATDTTVYSCSSDGIIKVHLITEAGDLSCVFVSETLKTSSGRPLITRHIRCLEVGVQGLLYGEDARNLKILDWKKGLIQKVPNHTSNFTSIDALRCHDNLLLTSSYDLDQGLGYVNVRSSTSHEYLATLDDEDTGRIMCLDSGRLPSGHLFVVTGGMELKVWELLDEKSAKKRSQEEEDIIKLDYRRAFAEPAVDSESESSDDDGDSDDSEDEEQDSGQRRDGAGQSRGAGLLSWCHIL